MILSVIIPFHDYNSLLDRMIFSILPQLTDDMELILVGDGITEGTALKISLKYPSIAIYTIPKSGANVAREYGMKRSIGEYLLFADSDDILPINTLQTYHKIIHSHAPDMIIGNVLRHTDATARDVFYTFKKTGQCRKKNTLSNTELYYFPVLLFCKCLKRKIIENISFAKSSMYQDFQLTCNAFKNSDSFFFTQTITYHYYIRDNSLSSKAANNRNNLLNALPAIDEVQNYYNQFHLSALEKKFLLYSIIKFYFTLIKRAIPLKDKTLIHDLRQRFKSTPYVSLQLKNIRSSKPYIIAHLLYCKFLFAIYYYYHTSFKRA